MRINIKQKIKNFFSGQTMITLAGLLIIFFISVPLYRNVHQRYIIDSEMSELEKDIENTRTKNDELQKMLEYLKSDQFVEEQARLNLDLKKPNEEVAVIKTDKRATSSPQDKDIESNIFKIPGLQAPAAKNYQGNFAKWWGYFFRKQQT